MAVFRFRDRQAGDKGSQRQREPGQGGEPGGPEADKDDGEDKEFTTARLDHLIEDPGDRITRSEMRHHDHSTGA